MAVHVQLTHAWHRTTGRDVAHSAREIRVLQVKKLSEIGKTGKAAHLSSTSLTNFLLADVTGDAINTAAERAFLWRNLVRDRSQSPHTLKASSETDKAFRDRLDAMRTADEATDPHAMHDILPGANLGAGIDAMLDGLSNLEFDIPLSYGAAPFAQIVSHMQFKIELRIGDNEGPVAIVSTMNRQDRYMAPDWPATKLRPVVSVVTIEVPHLVTLAHLWADTKAYNASAEALLPPMSSASPAGARNENAEAVPTTSALSEVQLNRNDRNADTTRKASCLSNTELTPVRVSLPVEIAHTTG